MRTLAPLFLAACTTPGPITTATATETMVCDCDPVTVYEQGSIRMVETLGVDIDEGCLLAELGEGEALVSAMVQDDQGRWLTDNEQGFPVYEQGGEVIHLTTFGCSFQSYRVWIAVP